MKANNKLAAAMDKLSAARAAFARMQGEERSADEEVSRLLTDANRARERMDGLARTMLAGGTVTIEAPRIRDETFAGAYARRKIARHAQQLADQDVVRANVEASQARCEAERPEFMLKHKQFCQALIEALRIGAELRKTIDAILADDLRSFLPPPPPWVTTFDPFDTAECSGGNAGVFLRNCREEKLI